MKRMISMALTEREGKDQAGTCLSVSLLYNTLLMIIGMALTADGSWVAILELVSSSICHHCLSLYANNCANDRILRFCILALGHEQWIFLLLPASRTW